MTMTSRSKNILLAGPSEALLVVGGFLVLTVAATPIPTVMLDVLLSFSVAFSLVILLVAVFMLGPQEFSAFPSLPLIVTLTAPLIESAPVILTSPDIRILLKRFTARFIPGLAVLSQRDLVPDVNVRTLKVISFDAD